MTPDQKAWFDFAFAVLRYLQVFTLGFCAGIAFTIWRAHLRRKKREEQGPLGMPPQLFDLLKKSGIPFSVEKLGGDDCQCATCRARRGEVQNKSEDDRVLH